MIVKQYTIKIDFIKIIKVYMIENSVTKNILWIEMEQTKFKSWMRQFAFHFVPLKKT